MGRLDYRQPREKKIKKAAFRQPHIERCKCLAKYSKDCVQTTISAIFFSSAANKLYPINTP